MNSNHETRSNLFACDLCRKVYRKIQHFKRHVKILHSEKSIEEYRNKLINRIALKLTNLRKNSVCANSKEMKMNRCDVLVRKLKMELHIGDNVDIQDVSKPGKPGKWTKTCVVTDCFPFQSYEIKVDGSNLMTKKNRIHLRRIIPFVCQSMLEEPESRLPPQQTPNSTRSQSTPASHLPTSSWGQTYTCQEPQPGTKSQTQDKGRTKPTKKISPHLREKWILANDNHKVWFQSNTSSMGQTYTCQESQTRTKSQTQDTVKTKATKKTPAPLREKWILANANQPKTKPSLTPK